MNFKIKWIGPPGEKELHYNQGEGWKHYTKMAVLIEDYKDMPGGSAGWRAAQTLQRLGYTYEDSKDDQHD